MRKGTENFSWINARYSYNITCLVCTLRGEKLEEDRRRDMWIVRKRIYAYKSDGWSGRNEWKKMCCAKPTDRKKNKNVRYHYNMSRGFKAMIVQGFGLRT